MGINYAKGPFIVGMSFKMGTFSNPVFIHPGIFILESPPPPGEAVTKGNITRRAQYVVVLKHCQNDLFYLKITPQFKH